MAARWRTCRSRLVVGGTRRRLLASVGVEDGARPSDSITSSDDDASVANYDDGDDDDANDDANQRIAAKMAARAAWPRRLRDENRDDDDEGVVSICIL